MNNTSFITYDCFRFLAIVEPLRYQQIMTPRRATFLVVLLIGFATMNASMPLYQIGDIRYTFKRYESTCAVTWQVRDPYSWLQTMALVVVPIGFLGCCYLKIFRVARRQQRQIVAMCVTPVPSRSASLRPPSSPDIARFTQIPMEELIDVDNEPPCMVQSARISPSPIPTSSSSTPPSVSSGNITSSWMLADARRRARRATVSLLLVIGVFLVCVVPKQLVTIWSGGLPGDSQRCYVTAVSSVLSYANSAINPFVYSMFNRRYRNSFIESIRKIPCCSFLVRFRRESDWQQPGSVVSCVSPSIIINDSVRLTDPSKQAGNNHMVGSSSELTDGRLGDISRLFMAAGEAKHTVRLSKSSRMAAYMCDYESSLV